MNTTDITRGFFVLVFSAIIAWGLYDRHEPDPQDNDPASIARRWSPTLAPCLLPVCMLTLFIMLAVTGVRDFVPLFGATCFSIFLHACVYYVLLIAAIPLLRRWISARACAAMWLLPNMLYITTFNYMQRSEPKWVIHLNGSWLRWAILVWLAGAAAVFSYKLVEHISFRRKLLASSWEEHDADTVNMWASMQRGAKIKNANIALRRSREISSPLSVGIFRASTFVILPDSNYTREETELILRHELIHIVRCDAMTKMFLTLCTAVCWFNPLMWVAMRRCSEDLELSCDELVLENADDTGKRRYADLILSSTGELKGFTSSLAPGAESLRYRLRQIMSPAKRRSGGLIAGAVLFLLLASSGMVSIAYGEGTAAELAFDGNLPRITISTATDLGSRDEYGGVTLYARTCTDPEVLLDYIAGLNVCRLSGNYGMNVPGQFVEMFLPGSGGPRLLLLDDKCLRLTYLGANTTRSELWYLNESPDWDYINSLLEERRADAVILQPPDMKIVFGPESVIDPDVFTARGKILEKTIDGEPLEYFDGWEESYCAIDGVPVEWAAIDFDFDCAPEGGGEVSITAWNPDRTESCEMNLDEEGRIMLLPSSAHYTVDVLWNFQTGLGLQVYRMEYSFDVIMPEE